MATYFHGNSEIQGDGLQTLILMNPGYVPYSDTSQQQQQPPPPGSNFVFLNSASNHHSLTPATYSHAPPPHHTPHLVGVPLSVPQDHYHHSQQDVSALHGFVPRVQYNPYNSVNPAAARDYTRSTQGLSLSLSPQNPAYGSFKSDLKNQPPGSSGVDDVRVSGGSPTSGISSGGGGGIQSVLLSSKYLKVTQELLDEVVSVGKGAVKSELSKENSKSTEECLAASGEGLGGGDNGAKRGGVELTTAERQEVQMKKAKLVNMLDEVEQRYRQYHHQMQIVISWFEQAAGHGSAKTYTALALQTISKQFRCLKDAITGQIKSASKSLGEDEGLETDGKMEGSRLKFVDNQIRQQRALQKLGMIQHNAWRPQRGLPERSVSVLRAWLFEHFLHPYPKDSDKHMLAKQTGLTRSQVSNWFINARVRLWKPMVEEMYTEEIKEKEHNQSPDKTTTTQDSPSKSTPSNDKNPVSVSDNSTKNFNFKQNNPHNTQATSLSAAGNSSPAGGMHNSRNNSGFTLIGSSEMEGITQSSPKKQRNSEILQSSISFPSVNMGIKSGDDQMTIKFGDERQNRDGFTLMGAPTNFIGGFGSYPIGDIGRFGSDQFPATFPGNGVSLTLGLPHCENLPMSGTHHQGFLPNQSIHLGRRVEISQSNDFGTSTTPTSSHSTTAFEGIANQNRKRFAAQLLPDYVT